MKTLVHNSIEIIPANLWRRDFTMSLRPSRGESAGVKSTSRSKLSALPPSERVMDRKRYVGPIAHLHGKTALVEPRIGAAGEVMAQFEELHLQEARGWWQFSRADFETLGPLSNR